MRRFICHCCGDSFKSDKPKDPQRDNGYGTCEKCHPIVIKSWTEHGLLARPFTEEEAKARLAKFA